MPESTSPEGPNPEGPSKEQLKGAMKAFKKRLKLTRLDQESQLSRRPTTTGHPSDVVAIVPPDQYPQVVWDELVRQGKLKRDKHGMYEMIDPGV
jgi:hypothetical protein